MIYIIMVLLFSFVWSLTSGLLNIFCKEKPIDKLKYYDSDYVVKEIIENKKKNKPSLLKILSNLIPNMKFSEKHDKRLEIELMKSDIPITGR